MVIEKVISSKIKESVCFKHRISLPCLRPSGLLRCSTSVWRFSQRYSSFWLV